VHGGGGGVAREHHGVLDAEAAQPLHGGGRVLTHPVAEHDVPGEGAVHRDHHGHMPRGALRLGHLDPTSAQEGRLPDGDLPSAHEGHDAESGHLLDGGSGGQRDAPVRGGIHDGASEHVARVLLGGGDEAEQAVLVAAVRRPDRDDLGKAVGQGSGLVEGHRAGAGELLERGPAFDDHAVARPTAHPGDERDRRRDEQRARRRDHEHLGEPGRLTGQRPAQAGEAEGDGREGHRVAIGKPNHRRLALGRRLHHLDDALVLALLRGGRGPQGDGPGPVDAPREQGVTLGVLHRHALARERGLVHGRRLGLQDPVDRDHLAGAHAEEIADADLADGHVDHRTPVQDAMRGHRGALEQRAEFPLRPPAGIVLERFAAGEHHHDHHGRPELPDQDGREDRGDRQDVHTRPAAQQRAHHPDRLGGGDRKGVGREQPSGPRAVARGVQHQPGGEGGERPGEHGVAAHEDSHRPHAPSEPRAA